MNRPGDFYLPTLGSKPGIPPAPTISPAYPPAQGFTTTPSTLVIGAALDFTQKELGGPVTEFETNPTASTTVGIAIDGNGDRVGLIIVNQGANDVFIAVNPAVSASNGIRLGANGGNVTMSVRNDYTLMSRRWYMIAAAATSAVYVLELSRFSSRGGIKPV